MSRSLSGWFPIFRPRLCWSNPTFKRHYTYVPQYPFIFPLHVLILSIYIYTHTYSMYIYIYMILYIYMHYVYIYIYICTHMYVWYPRVHTMPRATPGANHPVRRPRWRRRRRVWRQSPGDWRLEVWRESKCLRASIWMGINGHIYTYYIHIIYIYTCYIYIYTSVYGSSVCVFVRTI